MDLIYLKFVLTDFFQKIISPSAGELSFSTSLLQHFTAESSRETSRGKC